MYWCHGFRLLSAASAVLIALLTTGCGSGTDGPPDPLHVGIVLFGDSRQPQTRGFIEGMEELGYVEGRGVRYSIRNAQNDRQQLPDLVDELLEQNVDLLAAAGGLEADTMKKLTASRGVPVVVLYVNAIKERGLVIDRRQHGWPVTGVDNLNAELSSKRVELLRDLAPRTRRVLILYYPRIAPSRIGVERARAAAKKMDLEIDARPVHSRQQIRQVMEALQPGEVDAMLTVPTAPIDNALTEIILPNVERLQVPLMTHSRPMAEAGALASYGAPFYAMGHQAARLAHKILQGIAPANIPFETPKRFVYTINKDVQKRLNLELTASARAQINDVVPAD